MYGTWPNISLLLQGHGGNISDKALCGKSSAASVTFQLLKSDSLALSVCVCVRKRHASCLCAIVCVCVCMSVWGRCARDMRACLWVIVCMHAYRGPISHNTPILSLRYPISRDTSLREVSTPPKWCDPPLLMSFTQAHLCDTPCCNVWRDICVMPQKNKHERVLQYYRYKHGAIRKVSLLGL